MQGLHVPVVGGPREGGLAGGVGAEGPGAGPGIRGVALAPPVLESSAVPPRQGRHLEVAVGAAVAALVDVAGVQAALAPGIDVGALQTALGPVVDLHLAVRDAAVAADVEARAPGVLEQPAAGRVVVADDQDAVAARQTVAGAVVDAGAEAEEIVVHVETGGQRTDRVEPHLLLLHVAEPHVLGDPDGAARPVPARGVLRPPGVEPVGRGAGRGRGVGPAVRVGEPAVGPDPVERGLGTARLPARRPQPVVHVPLGPLGPHVVLDPRHRLHQPGRPERPAGTARILVLDLGDPGPPPPLPPVDGSGPSGAAGPPGAMGEVELPAATGPTGLTEPPGPPRWAAPAAGSSWGPGAVSRPCAALRRVRCGLPLGRPTSSRRSTGGAAAAGVVGPRPQSQRGPRDRIPVGEMFADGPPRPVGHELRAQLPRRLDVLPRLLRHSGPQATPYGSEPRERPPARRARQGVRTVARRHGGRTRSYAVARGGAGGAGGPGPWRQGPGP